MVFLLKSGAPFLWLAVANMAIMWTDIIVLGLWTDPATVGIYGIAQRVATTLTFLLLAANSVTAPRFATLHARGDHAALQHLASRSALWLAVAATPLVAVLLLLPGKVMGFFGDAFVIGHPALQILVAGQFVNVLTGSVGYLLMMTGHERDLRNIVFVSATANVLGNLVLVPALGMIGAAIATAGSLAFMNIGAYVAVRRRLRVDTLDYLKHLAGRWRNRSDR
jgi:O-antigen/teichoic acid export membrane protein